MAFPNDRTLGDVRREVAIACNLGSQPTRTKQAQPIIDNRIREAHAELKRKTEWLAAFKTATIDLTAGTAVYDFPDDVWPANISAVRVIDADGNRVDLDAGVRSNEMNSAGVTNAMPVLYNVIDRQLKLFPTPDATWETLEFEYEAASSALIEDSDPLSVDFDILVKLATRKCRAYFKLPPLESVAEYNDAENNAIADQSDGETFHFGGHQSAKLDHPKSNRINRAGSPLSGDGWVPPGF